MVEVGKDRVGVRREDDHLREQSPPASDAILEASEAKCAAVEHRYAHAVQAAATKREATLVDETGPSF